MMSKDNIMETIQIYGSNADTGWSQSEKLFPILINLLTCQANLLTPDGDN